MNTIFKHPAAAAVAHSLPLPEVIYQQLRLDILNGALKRGQLLRQEELAHRFNVSRVPLREALSRLEADGLIMLRPRRGYAVMSLDAQDIVEIFDLRMVVEEHAGRLAALARTSADIVDAETILEKMEGLNRHSDRHFEQWFRYNHKFHACIIAACRRGRVIKLAGTLRDAVEPYIRAESEHRKVGHVRDADTEHREMFEAFRAGDSDGLGELSRKHVQRAANLLLRGLRKHAARPSRSTG